MEIRVLRYFLTVVREENITRAAEVLHITQPTLSRQLAQLETQMGVKLFLRGTRKIVLTDEGLLLRRRAEEILELVDKTEHELTGQDGKIEGTVSIGCGDLKAVEELAELIRTFHEQYPLVTFDLYTASADYVRDRMDRGLTDIGLLLEPVDLGKYDYIRMAGEERCVVTMHPDAPLAKKEYITPQDPGRDRQLVRGILRSAACAVYKQSAFQQSDHVKSLPCIFHEYLRFDFLLG